MSKGNRIELIGIDDGANQAIDLACCKKFSSIKKSSIVKLNRDVDIESLVVVVATRIDSYIVENLISHIKEEQKPILIVPKTLERAYELEILYIKTSESFYHQSIILSPSHSPNYSSSRISTVCG